MSNLPPLVRIEVEEMKHSVMHYLGAHHQEIEEQVKAQLERVIENYDFERRVREAIHTVIDGAILGYFKYGQGREAVEKAVWASLDKALGKEG